MKTATISSFYLMLAHVVLFMLGFMLVAPIFVSRNAKAPFSVFIKTTLLRKPSDYTDNGIVFQKVVSPRFYQREVLTTGHLPLFIRYSLPISVVLNGNMLNKFLSHHISRKTGADKTISFSYWVLVNESYVYQKPVYKTVNYTYNISYIDNSTGENVTKTVNSSESVLVGYENVSDYRWVWKKLGEIKTLSLGKQGFVVVDIQGVFKASLGSWGVDIIPVVNISGFVKKFSEFAWWNSDWSYYKVCNINSNGYSGFYQMRLNVSYNGGGNVSCEGHCNQNFSDLRFVQVDNSTVLPYWVEYKVDGSYAIIWVNISSQAMSDGKILMYYGNPSASSASNGDSVWNWYEEWNTDYTNDYVRVDRNLGIDCGYYKSSPTIDLGFRYLAKYSITDYLNSAYGSMVGTGVSVSNSSWVPSDGIFFELFNDNDVGATSSAVPLRIVVESGGTATAGAWDAVAFNLNTPYVYEITAVSSSVYVYMKDVNGNILGSSSVTSGIPTGSFYYHYMIEYAAGTGGTRYFSYNSSVPCLDYGLIRETSTSELIGDFYWSAIGKYSSSEPFWSSFGSEQTQPAAGRTWQNITTGYILFNNVSNYENMQTGYMVFQNVSNWQSLQTGFFSFQNTTNYQNISSGWLMFHNISSYQDVTTGWFDFQNISNWGILQQGWITFHNISSYKNIQQGYFTFSNISSYKTITTGFFTFKNISSFQNLTSGWFSISNISSFQNLIAGYILFGNTSNYQNLQTGWLTFYNTSSYQNIDSGWLSFQNTTATWQNITSGYFTLQNISNWENIDSGWFTFTATGNWNSITSGWFVFGNISNHKTVDSGWFIFKNITSYKTISSDWFSFTGQGIWDNVSSGYFVFENVTSYKTVSSGFITFSNVSNWGNIDSGYFTFGNNVSWGNIISGWFIFGNQSVFKTFQSGWFVFSNISFWSNVSSGYMSFRNISFWRTVDSGWFIFGNQSSFENISTGFIIFGNQSSYNVIDSGWFDFSNVSVSWKNILSSWFSFVGQGNWQNISTGYIVFGNTSMFETVSSGWFIFGNITVSWSNISSGYFVFSNTSSWKNISQGWFTFIVTGRVWNNISSGWFKFVNISSYKNISSGWFRFVATNKTWNNVSQGFLVFSNLSIHRDVQSGYFVFSNVPSWVNMSSGWFLFNATGHVWRNVSFGWFRFEGKGIHLVSVTPLNGSVNQELNVTLGVTVVTYLGNINISWYIGNSTENCTNLLGVYTDVGNGTYYMPSNASGYDTRYYWRVNASAAELVNDSFYRNWVMWFETKPQMFPLYIVDTDTVYVFLVAVMGVLIGLFMSIAFYRRRKRRRFYR